MAGEIQEFFIVELNDLMYKSHLKWTAMDYDVARMDEDTARRVAKRYPGAIVSKGFGYDFALKTFEELEPHASRAIQDSVILAKRDGMSLETLLVTAEKAWHATKAA